MPKAAAYSLVRATLTAHIELTRKSLTALIGTADAGHCPDGSFAVVR